MTAVKQVQSGPDKLLFPNMVWIPGGTFLMDPTSTIPKKRRLTK